MSLSNKVSVQDVDLTGKRVIVRVDYNVISAVTGLVSDETRITASIPTLKYILSKNPKSVAILSHCGRPNGKVDARFSLKAVTPVVEKYLGVPVTFLENCVGAETVSAIQGGGVFLCENLRFHAAEEGPADKVEGGEATITSFKNQLGELGDIVVLDAFGTAHRAHASIVGIDKQKVAGLLLKKELDYFGMVLENPKRPFLAIIGGAKVKDKIQVVRSLITKVDEIIIGGGMAYTFLKNHFKMDIGKSLYDKSEVTASAVVEIMAAAEKNGVKLHFPVDFNTAEKYSNDSASKIVTREQGVQDTWEGLDCGPKSIELFKEVIGRAKMICWNGPMGVFEFSNFAHGSMAVLDAVCEATKNGCITVVGGGDSAAMTASHNKSDQMSHVSTGGGASLELLEGKILPGVAALADK